MQSSNLPLSDKELAQLAGERFLELDRREDKAANCHGRDAGIVILDSKRAMSDVSHVCPKCGGQMEQGFTVDMGTGNLSPGAHVSKWARGAPLKSFLFTTWVPWDSLPIGTFRCTTCGYLESYARKEFAAPGQTQFSLRSLLIFVTVVAVLLGIIVWFVRSLES